MAASESAPSLYVVHDPLKARDHYLAKIPDPLGIRCTKHCRGRAYDLELEVFFFHLFPLILPFEAKRQGNTPRVRRKVSLHLSLTNSGEKHHRFCFKG